MKRKRVMVAPLDWGLGHATRCVPLIEELIERECEVWIASSGSALEYLRKEFPQLQSIELESYQAKYSRRLPLMLIVLLQIPKFLRAIWMEHSQVEKAVKEKGIELVIADNRFGCWSTNVPSVFITHQLSIRMPAWLFWLQPLINFFNHQFIKRFTFCWVPDSEGVNNLSGSLSKASIPARFIGTLSRFNQKINHELHNGNNDVLVILSGPEPQRTVLEELVLAQLNQLPLKAVVVRGIIESKSQWKLEGVVSVANFLSTRELQDVIEQSNMIICRSGYSTVMDLLALKRKAILIPTPGQTEQEYLAERLMQMKICFSMEQSDFDVTVALEQSKGFTGFSNIETSKGQMKNALDEALSL